MDLTGICLLLGNRCALCVHVTVLPLYPCTIRELSICHFVIYIFLSLKKTPLQFNPLTLVSVEHEIKRNTGTLHSQAHRQLPSI